MAITAEIKERQKYSDRERVKLVVTLDDGTKRDHWPYVEEGIDDAALEADAIAAVQAQLDAAVEAAANAPIDRAEVDVVVAKLAAAGSIEAKDTWEDLRDKPIATREVSR